MRHATSTRGSVRRWLPASAAALVALLAACGQASAAWRGPVDLTQRDGLAFWEDIAVGRAGRVGFLADMVAPQNALLLYSSDGRTRFRGERLVKFSNEFPSVCFDDSGATLVLATRNARDNAVRVYTRPEGGSFDDGQIVGAEPGAPYDIVTAPTGEVFAYWIGADAGANEQGPVRIAIRRPGARAFEPMQELKGRPARYPRLLLDRRGNAMITWVVHGELRYSIRPRGGTFGPPRVLAPRLAWRGQYSVAANRAGRVVAVWRARVRRQRPIRAALGTVGAGFGTSEPIGHRANRGPYVAVDEGGAAVVAWRRGERLRAALSRSGTGGFGAPRTLSGAAPDEVGVVATRGMQTVAWHESGSVKVARHEAGRRRFVKQTLAAAHAQNMSFDRAGRGRTVVAWTAVAAGRDKRIVAAVARTGHSFGSPATLARMPREAYDEGPYVDNAFVWWGRTDPGSDAVWYAGSWLLP